MYENKYCEDGLFINKWLSDANIRTYEKVVFKPKQNVPSNVFNIFTDFPMTAVQGDTSVMTKLMKMLSGNDDVVFEYLENYFAHMIQKPYEKSGVAIIFYSEKQGAGKDTPLDAIGKMLGSEYFLNTEDAENQIFGRFTAHLQKTIFVKIEECEFETNKKNESALLSWITASQRSYEGKGREPITLDDYKRFVMTTNKRVPVNVPESDRRFVLVHSSEERVGDREFWDSVYAELGKPETLQAYYHYLLNKDISKFNVRNRPTTDFYKEVKTTLRPYHAKFFQEQIEMNDDAIVFKWKSYDLFNEMKSGLKYELTLTRFGLDMKMYVDVLTKVKGKTANEYVTYPKQMKEFLESKGWWVEY
jgi:hypothetical protein